ncbi:hypothetical protein [Qipengyuania zhejiangensis]|uniref:hypothetical protein n=1 Tax=Qipengyuania zhejiangensis TaxID=3077782 RepID=UPI002D79AA14|nr:hypothetical protein [Qipengyuania sp. Z2]
MTDTHTTFWTGREQDAAFSSPAACESRATRFERTIRRRNILEYAAAALMIPCFAGLAGVAAWHAEWMFAGASLACLAAIVFVVAKLMRDGANLERKPEVSCRDHLRIQYKRQRDLLRSVPRWYLGPLGFGIASFFAVVVSKVAEERGIGPALDGIWVPLGGTIIFFLFVGLINLWAARMLDRQIQQLDSV